MATAPPVPELLERERELAALDAMLEDATRGRGRVVLVEGEAGVGKTSVLSGLRVRAAARGLPALTARAIELEREYPFEVVSALLRAALREPGTRAQMQRETPRPIQRLLGSGGEDGGPLQPSRALLDAVFRIVEALGQACGLVIAVDDVQWADAASLRALAYAAHRIEGLPVVLALARRTGHDATDPAAVAAIADDDRTLRLALSPLSLPATAALAGAHGRVTLDDDAVAAMHVVTHGNPLLIAHVLDDVARDGPDGLGQPHEMGHTAVAGLVLRRLAAASAGAQAVAEAVSVLGDGAAVAQVAALAELRAHDALAAAAELEELRLFSSDEAMAFAHPLLAAAVAGDAGPNARGLRHLRAADVLRQGGGTPTQIAGQLMRGPATGSAEAVDDLRAAARAARSRAAPETAAALLRRALAEPPPEEVLAPLHIELGRAERAAGQPEAAWGHLAFAVDEPLVAADVVIEAATAKMAMSGFQAAVDTLLQGAAVRDGRSPDDALQLTAAADWLNWFVPTAERRPVVLPDADSLSGATASERMALAGIVAHRVGPEGTADVALELARRSLADGALVSDSAISGDFAAGPMLGLLYAEQLDACARELDHLERASQDSLAATLVTSRFPLVHLLLLRGDVAAAIAEADALLAIREDFAGAAGQAMDNLLLGWKLLALLAHDGPAAAHAELRARGLDGPLGPADVYLPPVRAHVRLATGDVDGAVADATAWRAVTEAVGDPIGALELHTAQPLALHAAGRADEARAAAERELRRARVWGAPARVAGMLRCCARIAEDPRVGLAHLDEARELVADSPLRLERARTLLDLGMAQRRSGARSQAQATLQEAVQAACECQAHVLADTGMQELRVLGARPRRRAFSGADSLTASERRVAEMAAQGRTNRQIAEHLFLTVKTIDSHLIRAYRKLGISSRRDLAAALGQVS